MNQLKKHILFFDFLENHYVSNDEVSKQHLSVIKKSNFVKAANKSIVRSTHPPLETVVITCQDKKTEVNAIYIYIYIHIYIYIQLNIEST